ncbi:lipoprotein NlpI [Symmachiella dynata]|uniref:O-linked N-acetylglucosamine transferase family protein n=1 Tax=Symmachiella dynata TaxID=2527995 RepID=UPI00118789B1|nr:tetratricopeptide repeat protein [Symmachiella dynata]QDT48858.1 lipoprotein NlpI [Symmachiella dynata]
MTVGESLVNSALRFHRAGDYRMAEQFYTQILNETPAPAVHTNLGIVKRALGDFEGAIACYRRAIELDATCFEAHNNLGNLLWKQGRLAEALGSLKLAASLNPTAVMSRCTLGLIQTELGELDAAIDEFQTALRIAPEFAETHNGLGRALQLRGEFAQACVAYRRAIQLKPEFAAAHVSLGNALTALHRFDEACSHYRQALRINPAERTARDNLLMAMQYDPEFDVDELFVAHCELTQPMQCAAPTALLHDNDPAPLRRLRIGYVSPDFRKHSVAFFMKPILAKYDPSAVETFCYAQVAQPDETTQQLQNLAGHWRSTVGMSDAAVVELIRRDQIDILIDLAGHTAGNRLGVFSQKPAPIQVSYLGYGNTTGLSSVDYWLTDAVADPPGESRRHTETLIRLQRGIACYAPPTAAPDVAPPPMLRNGFLTFGSFNKRVKINPAVIRLWSRVLESLPTSRLVLKDRAYASPEMREITLAEFLRCGVEVDRIDLIPRAESLRDHLELYSRIDVALDPFPYGGSTTTCEALWMGVPVLTLRGNCYVSRMTSSLLTQIGLTGCIAETPDDFVRRAIAWDGQADCLAELRRELRTVCADSPLCDATGYTQELEAVYRTMWQTWCAQSSSLRIHECAIGDR